MRLIKIEVNTDRAGCALSSRDHTRLKKLRESNDWQTSLHSGLSTAVAARWYLLDWSSCS